MKARSIRDLGILVNMMKGTEVVTPAEGVKLV